MSRGARTMGPLEALGALAKGMWIALLHMFRGDDTVQYPFERRTPPARMHGRHILNRYPDGMEKCIGCELCAGACPADAILVWGAENPPGNPISPGERYGSVYQINMLRCIFCGLCVEACPTDAITMTTFFDFTGTSRSSMIYDKTELLEMPPGPEREKFGYTGNPIILSPEETEQPGVGSLHAGSQGAEHTEVPVVWLPGSTWRGPSEPDGYPPGELKE
jgi:NADH-quinone oxidoreductase chain I